MTTNIEAVLAVIQAAPLGGVTSGEIEDETGLTVMKVQHAIAKLRREKRITSERLGMSHRFFESDAARDASMPLIEELRAQAQAEKAKAYAAYQREYQEKNRAKKHALDVARYRARVALRAAKPPKPPKPAKPPQPIKLLQPKPVNRERAAREAWAAQEAIHPDGVKFTKCPGYTGESRFAPAPDCHGLGLTAEWKQLRRAA